MSRRKNFRQSDWPIESSPRKNVEPRIVGIRSIFRGSTFFRLVEIWPISTFGNMVAIWSIILINY